MVTEIKKVFGAAGIEITENQLEMFARYAELLLDWNKKINLTAITEKEDIAVKHFLDSLTVLKYIKERFPDNLSLIDIGTGAGFPGLPLKIMDERINLTLMDSLLKRIRFLCEAVSVLNLEKTECVHARAEDIKPGYREAFCAAVSRAVAPLNVLSVYALAYVKVGGIFIAMKGPDCEAEVSAAKESIKKMGGEINNVFKVKLAQGSIGRSIILIDKVRQTPPDYPKKLLKGLKSGTKSN
ncbi:MAG: 16S rRNA (guanine(527)-N(7))-methyltransferase RsmG [Clostridiales bacterium]|nr:16S rRNA (guanine(527)-N(7))-methyltransferase RsmG [Clostridiales bacterium]